MASWCCAMLFLLCAADVASSTVVDGMDYGGVPLWINRLLGEPSVLSLQGRIDPAWYRANNPLSCPEQCDCPIQWPTAVYCDHRCLANTSEPLPDRTQYLFLQVGKALGWCCYYNGLPQTWSDFHFPFPSTQQLTRFYPP